MSRFNNLMAVIVRFLAIRSIPDLIIKHVILTTFFVAKVMLLENTLFPPEDRNTLSELLPLLLIASFVVNGLLFSSATYQAHLQAALAELALTDALTGLNNRRAFLEIATATQKSGKAGFLLLIDADHFKHINDTYGHNVGDECLRSIAQHLQRVLGGDTPLGRLGGEEFAALLPGDAVSDLDRIAAQLTQGITATVATSDTDVTVPLTLSVGMTEFGKQETIEAQLHQADVALYEAKRQGRARLVKWQAMLESAA